MELAIDPTTVGLGSVLLTGIGLTLRKVYLDWMKSKPELASHTAFASQFKALQEAIDSNKTETIQLRAEVTRMDKTIHVQQRTITRMEMLLRQFSSVVQEQGITVPAFMQRELDDLLKADAERVQAANTASAAVPNAEF